MPYLYYRPIDKHKQLRTSSLNPVHKYLEELKLEIDTHKFTGKDPILIFDILIWYVDDTDKLAMSE